ncbi:MULTISPECIES: hypothetical protein [Streptomyces]|uniref:Uncharacterized protein n=1 Tax=Streptomyces luteosporeus TaxID=173856 RepID=A0ABN3TQK6_9ACTN
MTGKLVTRLSVAAASTFAAVALLGATPALAAAAGDDERAQQIEQAEEHLREAEREADPQAAEDRDTERRIAADQRDIEDGLGSGDSKRAARAAEDAQAIAEEQAAAEGDSEAE